MKFEIFFRDGPCALQTTGREMGEEPNPTTTCKGATYVLASRVEDVTGSNYGNIVVYVLLGGRYAPTVGRVPGENDVFRAWRRVHDALNKSTTRQVARVENARRRIRRAVR